MKILIAYGTTEGETRKICDFFQDKTKEASHKLSLQIPQLPQISNYWTLSRLAFCRLSKKSCMHMRVFLTRPKGNRHYIATQTHSLNESIRHVTIH